MFFNMRAVNNSAGTLLTGNLSYGDDQPNKKSLHFSSLMIGTFDLSCGDYSPLNTLFTWILFLQ